MYEGIHCVVLNLASKHVSSCGFSGEHNLLPSLFYDLRGLMPYNTHRYMQKWIQRFKSATYCGGALDDRRCEIENLRLRVSSIDRLPHSPTRESSPLDVCCCYVSTCQGAESSMRTAMFAVECPDFWRGAAGVLGKNVTPLLSLPLSNTMEPADEQ